MKRLIYTALLFIVIGAAISATAQHGKIVSVKASLDSAWLLMGKQTAIHVEVIGDLDGSGYFVPNDSLWNDVEIASESEAIITDLGNNRKDLKKDIIIQGFDSGLFYLPTVAYVQGSDTVLANKLSLKVVPVNVDTLKTIHDYAGVVSPGRNFFDFLPDWISDYGLWILLALIIIGSGIYLFIAWRKKGSLPLIPKKKPLSPYETAMRALDNLKSRNLCESGQEKEYYTLLTDILRNYLSGRFGISAMEMTSSQIMRSLSENEETRNSKELMDKILEMADFVKFAKMRPLPDDNIAALRNAFKFVEDTKPNEPEENSSENDPQPKAAAENEK